MKERDFINNKKETMNKLSKAITEKKVDKEILNILNLINSNEKYYTSSSCYGRIVLLELPKIGDKKNAKFLGKWHRKIQTIEFIDAFKKSTKGELWFLAQSPILHVFSKDLESGDNLVKLAVSCGFKNSGFRSIKKNIVIEIASTERLDMIIGKDRNYLIKEEFISNYVNLANEIIIKSKRKLIKLEENLKKIN